MKDEAHLQDWERRLFYLTHKTQQREERKMMKERNTSPSPQKDKTSEKDLNVIKTSDSPDT